MCPSRSNRNERGHETFLPHPSPLSSLIPELFIVFQITLYESSLHDRILRQSGGGRGFVIGKSKKKFPISEYPSKYLFRYITNLIDVFLGGSKYVRYGSPILRRNLATISNTTGLSRLLYPRNLPALQALRFIVSLLNESCLPLVLSLLPEPFPDKSTLDVFLVLFYRGCGRFSLFFGSTLGKVGP